MCVLYSYELLDYLLPVDAASLYHHIAMSTQVGDKGSSRIIAVIERDLLQGTVCRPPNIQRHKF